jgi:hypothetical protein
LAFQIICQIMVYFDDIELTDGRRIEAKIVVSNLDVKQTCIDLLQAKLDAQDAGRDFPVTDDFLCERCSSVFQELDMAVGMCRTCENLAPRPESRDRLLAGLGVENAPPPPESTEDCGCP